jgi:hypothetical protein
MNLTQQQREILARTALGEAGGEGAEGMEAVLHVIRNRANSGQYSSDPARVARQPGQFSAWNSRSNGGNDQVNVTSGRAYNDALAAVDAVFGGQNRDPTGGALNYWAPQGMRGRRDPDWARGEDNRTAIGNHVFLSKYDPNYVPLPAPAPLTAPRSPAPPSVQGMVERDAGMGVLPFAAPPSADQFNMTPGQNYNSPAFLDAFTSQIGSNLGPGMPGVSVRDTAPSPPQRGVGTPNLTSRSVRTVPIDPTTGNPIQSSPMTRETMWPTSRPPSGPSPAAPSPFDRPGNFNMLGPVLGPIATGAAIVGSSIRGQPQGSAVAAPMPPTQKPPAPPPPNLAENASSWLAAGGRLLDPAWDTPNVPLPRARPTPPMPPPRMPMARPNFPASAPAQDMQPGAITVQRGDTATALAKRLGMSVPQFAAAYGIKNPDRLYAGETLRPGGMQPAPTRQPQQAAPQRRAPIPSPPQNNQPSRGYTPSGNAWFDQVTGRT